MKALNILAAALLATALPVLAQNSFGTPQAAQSPQPQPPSGYGAAPAQPGFGAAPQGASADQMAQAERQDMGVPPTDRLHTGPMHGPTPNALPGGQVITTPGLIALMKKSPQTLVLDVLGGPEKLPGALYAVPAHQAGSFDDAVQREFGRFLQGQTQGRNDVPLVFYCQSTQCWMSYNAALRAVKLGYRNVLWYRGGVEAWKAAGQQMQPAQR